MSAICSNMAVSPAKYTDWLPLRKTNPIAATEARECGPRDPLWSAWTASIRSVRVPSSICVWSPVFISWISVNPRSRTSDAEPVGTMIIDVEPPMRRSDGR